MVKKNPKNHCVVLLETTSTLPSFPRWRKSRRTCRQITNSVHTIARNFRKTQRLILILHQLLEIPSTISQDHYIQLLTLTAFSTEKGKAERFDQVCKVDGRFKELHGVPVDAHVSARANVNVVERNSLCENRNYIPVNCKFFLFYLERGLKCDYYQVTS